MARLTVHVKPGRPVYEQIVFAVNKAPACGVLRPGERFPWVRALSQQLRVNPNTVQKAVAELTQAGVLEVHTGQSTYLAPGGNRSRTEDIESLHPLLERLVVESAQRGLREEDLVRELARAWRRLRVRTE